MPIDLNDDRQAIIREHPLPTARQERKQCPCGAEAVWFRRDVVIGDTTDGSALDVETATRGVQRITGNDLYEDLCEECFQDAVPASDHKLWKRIETIP